MKKITIYFYNNPPISFKVNDIDDDGIIDSLNALINNKHLTTLNINWSDGQAVSVKSTDVSHYTCLDTACSN